MKHQQGFTGVEVAIFVMALTSVVSALTPMFATPEPRCWSGYLYDGMNGRQIIGENGGGIRCEMKEPTKD